MPQIFEDLALIKAQVADVNSRLDRFSSKEAQILLFQIYKDLTTHQLPHILPDFTEVGFRCYSQFEEDGILLYLFSVIGTTNKIAVEISAGDGFVCNTTNLIVNHGWWGFLIDGNETNVERGNEFFSSLKDTWLYPPKFICAWITAENVNNVLRSMGVEGPIDLLSLDIDGMDYWVWKAIDCIQPRIVVCETQNIIGPEDALTVPYDPDFIATTQDYQGASLAAMTKLAKTKGYRLIGTHRFGFNAFYIKEEIAGELFPTVSVEGCLQDPYTLASRAKRWPKVRDLKWERV